MPRLRGGALPVLAPEKTSRNLGLRLRGGASALKAGACAPSKTSESLEARGESIPPAWALKNPAQWLRTVQGCNKAVRAAITRK